MTGEARGEGIVAEGLVKSFGPVRALDGVSLAVGAGQVVGLLGPNGAGKSTLLRILGTTVLPDEGTARVGGFDVTVEEGQDARRSAGLVLGDERAWYLRLSGRENLRFFAALEGLGRREAVGRTDELLGAFGLVEAGGRAVQGYSAGMRAKLALARALLADPPVLLLDEPTRSLDPVAAVEFRELARGLADEGRAVLLTTHDLHEAAAVADRVVVLSEGRVVAEVEEVADAASLEAVLRDGGGSA